MASPLEDRVCRGELSPHLAAGPHGRRAGAALGRRLGEIGGWAPPPPRVRPRRPAPHHHPVRHRHRPADRKGDPFDLLLGAVGGASRRHSGHLARSDGVRRDEPGGHRPTRAHRRRRPRRRRGCRHRTDRHPRQGGEGPAPRDPQATPDPRGASERRSRAERERARAPLGSGARPPGHPTCRESAPPAVGAALPASGGSLHPRLGHDHRGRRSCLAHPRRGLRAGPRARQPGSGGGHRRPPVHRDHACGSGPVPEAGARCRPVSERGARSRCSLSGGVATPSR